MRQATGRQNKRLRKQGLIPAVLYGHKIKNINLTVKAADFNKIYQEAGESTLIKLEIDDKEKKDRVALIHNIQTDPATDEIIHADFYQVKMDEVLKAEIPLIFVGKSEAVEKEGGLLIKNIQHLEIEALPQDLIHNVEVDISPLKTFDSHIYVRDLRVPEKIKVLAASDEVVASVIPPRTQEELEKLKEKPAEEIEKIKVEGEGLPAGDKEEKQAKEEEKQE